MKPQEALVLTVARNATKVGPPLLISIVVGRNRISGATMADARNFLDDLERQIVTRGPHGG